MRTIDIDELKKKKKIEIIAEIEAVQSEWFKELVQLTKQNNENAEAMRGDLHNHPDYVGLKKDFEHLQVMYKESERQRKDLTEKLEVARSELRELRSRKPVGRPGLSTETVERIVLLRSAGLSIRKIAAELNISKSVVAKYIDVLNINGQSQDNV
ncbi:MAG: helix-turn-helix domain-containing protein [Anaerolineaceae bacterium]|nr:helix-turn-helix domain-containing protein [Anaerolineaceae bacterium]